MKKKSTRRGRLDDGSSDPVDIQVGIRIRLRRTLINMTQEQLGEALGVSFQQVQKYERGDNRVGASRLFDLARILDVPINFFFDDMPEEMRVCGAEASGVGGIQPAGGADPMSCRETLDLVRTYYSIPDERVRRTIYDLAKKLGKSGD